MITKAQLDEFETWFREYFDPEHEELPDAKYLARWAEKHGEDLLKELRERSDRIDICPSCNHPRCEARCDLADVGVALTYVPGRKCPCCGDVDHRKS